MSDRSSLEVIADRPDVSAAVTFAHEQDESTLDMQSEISEIPAPPFGEGPRGSRLAEIFEAVGLEGIRQDEVGNVVAERPARETGPHLVVSAHLDTVFPAGTDVSVTRSGNLLSGPGISDDARGLASLVTLARMLDAGAVRTTLPLLFVATVGEEGLGDLRGVKHLFETDARATSAQGFISLDGAGVQRIVVEGLGSRRYRIVVRGPGGHSWTDWGTPNPIDAITAVTAALTRIQLSADPRSTLTVARIGGGTSINAIPQEAWAEVDTRSSVEGELERLEEAVRSTVRRTGRERVGLDFDTQAIGVRPGGRTARTASLVRAAAGATRLLGHEPSYIVSSTDANVPMALGIPAITLGCGGVAGQTHTTAEWYRNVGGPDGIVRAFYTVALEAGLESAG